ncbi:hypothetical protein, partial [Francisella tularensis]|uniref:hypothetical protein n=1 Tax=Francisella tularensis TaxID=263 RepID=UPI001CD5FBDB
MAEPRECKRCHEIKKIVGRNLCHPCYGILKRNNQLDSFPVRKGNENFQEIKIDINGVKNKECSICHQLYSLDNFGRNPQSSIGYLSWCKNCRVVNRRKR